MLSGQLEPGDLYEMLARATAGSGSEHLWKGGAPNPVQMMSWAEHRRRRVLERVIDSCEAFKVDLLVLPEYSVRPETVEWLKNLLAGKRVPHHTRSSALTQSPSLSALFSSRRHRGRSDIHIPYLQHVVPTSRVGW